MYTSPNLSTALAYCGVADVDDACSEEEEEEEEEEEGADDDDDADGGGGGGGALGEETDLAAETLAIVAVCQARDVLRGRALLCRTGRARRACGRRGRR